jgi:hypothetical protein
VAILSTSDYPEIREQLDVTLDSTLLPDATIGRDAFVGEAEREVLARDPLALSYSAGTDNAKRVRLAAIYLTAARLAVALPVLTSEEVSGASRYQRAAWDPAVLASRLRQLAGEVFAAYLETSGSTSSVPFAFGLACGRRGR